MVAFIIRNFPQKVNTFLKVIYKYNITAGEEIFARCDISNIRYLLLLRNPLGI